MPERTVVNPAGMREFLRSPGMRALLLDAAKATVRRAQVGAPKRTGAGAASIRGEAVLDRGEWTVRISWDRAHGYMRFPNFGTRYIRAQHFLERAAGAVNLRKGRP